MDTELRTQSHEEENVFAADRLSRLEANLEKFRADEREYYDSAADRADAQRYYASVQLDGLDGRELYHALTDLLERTHTNRIRYKRSDDYLKTLVDLHDDGFLRSIYSGKEAEPHKVIEEDEEDEEEFTAAEDQITESGHLANVEHVVPQSWFNEKEPMRGDLHHLFYCEKDCNSFRGNKVYWDFADYNPDLFGADSVRNECGKGEGGEGHIDGRFEPEHGKGMVARAMLYFILRYPRAIELRHKVKMDIDVLLKWHKDFPPNLKYEKHRNQEIYQIQGNRNPLIDLPQLADRIDFSVFRPLH
ncbi:endonuclease I [Paenibacillus oralis]|uniref:Endonuclease I n=1 Tax=Paenibacillus oralis TaxID=2490856 RepID=A0A3P3U2T8_9BACL|nr:endonuclease [Paenibacillus oralis]RRJ64657.1 endonuclease I [Paenibacillus oralis]